MTGGARKTDSLTEFFISQAVSRANTKVWFCQQTGGER